MLFLQPFSRRGSSAGATEVVEICSPRPSRIPNMRPGCTLFQVGCPRGSLEKKQGVGLSPQEWARGCQLPWALITCVPQRNSSLPDENNVARLQEELKALKVREGEAVASARELKLQLQELSDTWQVRA